MAYTMQYGAVRMCPSPQHATARELANAWICTGLLGRVAEQKLRRQRDALGLLEWHRKLWRRQEAQFKLESTLATCVVSTLLCLVFDFAESLPLGHAPEDRDEQFRRMGHVALFGLTAWLPGITKPVRIDVASPS